MNKLFESQKYLQSALGRKHKYTHDLLIGDVYDDLIKMKFFIDEEMTELLEALGDGTRDIHKPWKSTYEQLRAKQYVSTKHIREEAIDMLCFAVNVCLGVGLDEHNIHEEYAIVLSKNLRRIKS